ncbi:MAG: penicillin-binding protein 2 [Syntrophobacterales bacterium]|nr:MAG: penicillin-binding protein 2 [Syntrophobacterales bacterium]
MKLNSQGIEDLQRRYKPFLIAALIGLLVLGLRAWYLQIVKGEEFSRLSQHNRIRIREIPASRGMILDQGKRILVDNRPSFEVLLVPEDIVSMEKTTEFLHRILRITPVEVAKRLEVSKHRPPFKPVRIQSDISRLHLALLKTHKLDLPGLIVDVRPRRAYTYGNMASHLLGYLGEIDGHELRQNLFREYQLGDLIGQYGVEQKWEPFLKGTDGGRQVEVDAMGRELKVLQRAEPHPGNNVSLTIDLDLQMTCETLLSGKEGAIVAMNPQNGKILAMVSHPSFSPSLFAEGINHRDWETLILNPFHPLQNRVIQGQYAPGSVFKIITATAGLEEGVISPQEILSCSGSYRFGNRTYRCWRKGGHGKVNPHRAIVESCDVFFYQVGQRLGIDTLAKYAKGFGLGKPTEISLNDEKPGLIPSSEWKKKVYNEAWYEGETLSCAIGQGFILVTPLQLLNVISAFANGGVLYLPQLVERIETANGEVVKSYPPIPRGKIPISPENLMIIRQALNGVVNEAHGTGRVSRIKGITVSGKTGTAQVISLRDDVSEEDTPYEYRDHAWFVAYAPMANPVIAVVVLVEHGGHGASASAPIAREVMKKYFTIIREKGKSTPLIARGREENSLNSRGPIR